MWTVRNELTYVKKIVVYTGSVTKEKYSSDVLTWSELMALGNAQSSEGLDHVRVVIVELLQTLLLLNLLLRQLALLVLRVLLGGDPESQLVVAETHLLCRHVTGQENVDTFTHRERHGDDTVGTRSAIQTANEVRKIVKDGKVVFNNDYIFVILEQAADHTRCIETLLDVQV